MSLSRRARPAPSLCTHCGQGGHNSAPVMTTLLDVHCTLCVRDVSSARIDDSTYKIYVAIIPCLQHDMMVANPPVVGNPFQLAQGKRVAPGMQQFAPGPSLDIGQGFLLLRTGRHRGMVDNLNQGKTQ